MEGVATTRFSAVLHVPFEDLDPVVELREGCSSNSGGFETTKDDISSSATDRFVVLAASRDHVTVEIVMSPNEVGNDDDGNMTDETTISLSWNEDHAG